METRSQARRANAARKIVHQTNDNTEDNEVTVVDSRGEKLLVPKKIYDKFEDYTEMIPDKDYKIAAKKTDIKYEFINTPRGGYFVPRNERAIIQSKVKRNLLINKYESPYYEPECANHHQKSNGWFSCTWIISAIVILVVWLTIYYAKDASANSYNKLLLYYNNFQKSSPEDRINQLGSNFANVRSVMKNQNKDFWIQIYTSYVNIVKEPNKPSIIVLVGDDVNTLNCLTAMLAEVSNQALETSEVRFSPSKLTKSEGRTLEKIRNSLTYSKTVVVWDFINVNVEAMKAFHALLDRYNATFKEVIYLLVVIKKNESNSENPLRFLEDELEKKLKGKIDVDTVQPLITRITDGAVLNVKTEQISKCPVPKIYFN